MATHQPLAIEVYNLIGAKVYSLYESCIKSMIDLSSLPSGIYTCVLTTPDFTTQQKVVIAK